VLVALFVREGEPHGVFTTRREDLRRHAGEISFPGGREDPDDLDLIATALREAEEEVGLPPSAVSIVGALQPIPTFGTGYAIYPFVGLVEHGQQWLRSEREVTEVLELSLVQLRAGYGRRTITRRGVAFRTDTFVIDDNLIWGATARILSDLLERMGPPLTAGPATLS
jgi:8-oxo-dGTP pyrophosphatase MutT (NUDIX family)